MQWAIDEAKRQVARERKAKGERKTKRFPITEWSAEVRYNPTLFELGIAMGREGYRAKRARAERAIEALQPDFARLQTEIIEWATVIYHCNEATEEINAIVESETRKATVREERQAESDADLLAQLERQAAALRRKLGLDEAEDTAE